MRITELLDKRSISLAGAPANKEEALDQVVELMVRSGRINDKEAYRRQVYAREERSPPLFPWQKHGYNLSAPSSLRESRPPWNLLPPQALDQVVELMVRSGRINDKEAYRRQVYAREEESTTGIGEDAGLLVIRLVDDRQKFLHRRCIPQTVGKVLIHHQYGQFAQYVQMHVIFCVRRRDQENQCHRFTIQRIKVHAVFYYHRRQAGACHRITFAVGNRYAFPDSGGTLFLSRIHLSAVRFLVLRNAASVEEFLAIIDKADDEKASIDERLADTGSADAGQGKTTTNGSI